MPRGGSRPGAGRKADPNSARQKALAKKAAKVDAGKPDLGRGLTLPNGQKSPDAPEGWPFGTKPPEEPAEEKKETLPPGDPDQTPLAFLLSVMRDGGASVSARLQAAIQAAPYVHPKVAPQGVKDAKNAAAKKVSKFGSAPVPLALVKR